MRIISFIFIGALFIGAIFLLKSYNFLGLNSKNLIPDSYGVNPTDDSWKACKGLITIAHSTGVTYETSDNAKKNEYWTTRANRENNIDLCKNVGISEDQTDMGYVGMSKHDRAVMTCEYIFKNNPSYKDCTNY